MGMFDSVLQNYVGIKSRFVNGWVILFLHSFIFFNLFELHLNMHKSIFNRKLNIYYIDYKYLFFMQTNNFLYI